MERLQRFSIRKLSIGAVSCVIGTVAFLSYSNEAKAAENTDTSLKIVETNSANNPATSDVTVDNTNKQAVVNTLDQSKSEDSSAVAPTSEKTQLQTSQDSSTKVKENNLNNDKSDTTKAVAKPTNLNDENNLRDPDSKDVEVKPKESSNVDTNEQKENDVTLATNSPASETNASSKPVQTVSPEQSADTTDVQPASDQVESAAANSNAPENDVSAASASTVLSKQPANADTQPTATTSGVQPFMNLAVASDNNELAPKRETVDSTWTLHYVNQADHKQELKDPTVITMQYTRTNTPQSDGTTQYGDWSYVPGSFKQTGTQITVNDSDNPVKQDNIDKNGENFDVFTITAMYPTVAGYGFYNGINGTRLHDNLRNNERQADAMSKDFYAEYDVAKPTRETVTSQWTVHYVNSADHKQELKAPTVITMQYTRTDTPQSNGKIQYGDWSYVPGSFKLTGTPITVNGSDNPTKEDNVDKDGKNYDVFSIIVQHPDITGYELHNVASGARINDYLQNDESNGEIQAPIINSDRYVEYDVAKERSVAVKFVDDQSYDWSATDHKKQVGQALTLTGRDGDTVDLKLTVPDKYKLADGQQLPTTYTFKKGSGDVTIHLAHQVVQREATVDVQIGFMTLVGGDDESDPGIVVTQNQWTQLDDEIKKSYTTHLEKVDPTVGVVGTITGHVNYDLVDNKVVSFGNDWTTLNLGGQTYQMPDGTEVVNGIIVGTALSWGKKLKEHFLKYYPDDSDYVNRAWHGYLSVNKSDIDSDWAGFRLVGNESNALAKATGDRAATAIEMTNKPIDLSSLRENMGGGLSDFNEQDGQLRAKAIVPVVGMYIPYVEKTATRTINVTTPDGKTTSVKQTATLAKQIVAADDAHPAWTTSEWTSYDVPIIPGYTASQSNVAKEAVTGTTKDQTVNITYTANDGTQAIVYQDEDGSEIGKQVISGKTDEKVKVTPDVPDGYVLKGEVPSEVTIKPNDTPITVTVEHGKSHVTPDKPVNKGDLIPDTKDKHYPEGLTHNDLNKTVTREVTITDPTGKKSTTTQTVTFTRGATVDEVTNEVTYDDWSENGQHTFDKVEVPSVPGYTASGEVPEVVVTPETQSSTVTITYSANDGTQTIIYQDEDGSEVGKQVIPGKTDETVKVTPEVPNGYVVKSEIPKEVTIKPTDDPITVTVEHGKTHIDPTHPVNPGDHIPGTKDKTYPAGLTHDDLNKTVTRKVIIIDPTGKKTITMQTVTFTRYATVDEVTGKVTYGNWSENGQHTFDKVDVPTISGYTANSDVPSIVVTPSSTSVLDKVVTYVANEGSQTIIYVDENGKKVGQQVVTGKTGDKVKITPEIPSGYESNDKLPKEVTIKAKDEPLIAKVIEKILEVNPDQNVTDDDSNKNINQESTPEQPSEDTSKDTESHEVKTDNKKNHTISVQEKHSDHKKLGEKLTVTTKSESKLRTATSKHLEKMSNSTLPQTGESKDSLSIMGLVATALSGVFGFGLKKKKKE